MNTNQHTTSFTEYVAKLDGMFAKKNASNNSIGRTLRNAREKLNLSLKDVTKKTRINERYIFMLEEDKHSTIHHSYLSSYLNSLAKEYGIYEKVQAQIDNIFYKAKQGDHPHNNIVLYQIPKMEQHDNKYKNIFFALFILGLTIYLYTALFSEKITLIDETELPYENFIIKEELQLPKLNLE